MNTPDGGIPAPKQPRDITAEAFTGKTRDQFEAFLRDEVKPGDLVSVTIPFAALSDINDFDIKMWFEAFGDNLKKVTIRSTIQEKRSRSDLFDKSKFPDIRWEDPEITP